MSDHLTFESGPLNLEATMNLAKKVGSKLRGGEIIELISDLGGGKTTFVRGLAEGLGTKDKVHSPSFTISNQYHAGELTLYHFDFYRLAEPGIMRSELAEVVSDKKAVIVIEWPEIIEDVLPPSRLSIYIKPISETTRQLVFKYPKDLNYLVPS